MSFLSRMFDTGLKELRRCKKAFLERYCDEEKQSIETNSQTVCSFYMSIFGEDEELCKHLASVVNADIQARGYHTTCGNIGYRHLFYRLAEYGYAETLTKLLINDEYPGWGHMLKCGATTVWERWEADVATDMHSFNHPMFGAYDGFLYNYLAGIRTEECRNAFGEIVIEPCFVSELAFVDCSFKTVRGEISVSWKREGENVRVHIKTPANTKLCFRSQGNILVSGREYQGEVALSNGEFEILVLGV